MKTSALRSLRLLFGVAALLAVGLTTLALAQQSTSQSKGIPYDWSHHHVMFSNPGTFDDAISNGMFLKWQRIVSDPRFQQQQVRRGAQRWQASGIGAGNPDDLSLESLLPPRKAQKLKKDWSMNMGSGATVDIGQYPAIFSAYTQANCDNTMQPDFAVFNTSLTGSGAKASIIAYDNLYSSCLGEHPLVYFQYNTNGGAITTSVSLATDGVQMAFVQTVGGIANLVILKSQRNTQGSNAILATLTPVGASSYRNCSAPCMTQIALSGNPTDTYSSPYYDYANDVLYVGDDSGVLHKFQNIFNSGTPAEVTTSWPLNISSAAGAADPLTSPVLDSTSGNVLVFVTEINDNNGGKLARVPASGGTPNIVVSSRLAFNGVYGFLDAPLVDSTAEMVYGFTNRLATGGGNSGVIQIAATFGPTTTWAYATMGETTTTATYRIYDGAFDNMYYNSGNPASPTGNIYACGRAATSFQLTLYKIPITNNVMGSSVTGPGLANGTFSSVGDCSPITEFYNTTTGVDWIFLSVRENNKTGNPINCPSGDGCLMNFNVTNPSNFSTNTATTATVLETGGTSGIVVDNALSSSGGASNIYFSPLSNQSCAGNGSVGNGTGGCAIQASQAAP